jgi:hypothetical protein
VVKKRNKPGLRLFEATMDGVQVFNLTRRLQFYVKDTKIALRRYVLHDTHRTQHAIKHDTRDTRHDTTRADVGDGGGGVGCTWNVQRR